MEHTDVTELVRALREYRERYGNEELDLDKLEDLIRELRKKKRRRKKK